MTAKKKSFQLYIPSVGDELLLMKPIAINLATWFWDRKPNSLIALFNYEKIAYVDIKGNPVERMSAHRVNKEFKLTIPVGVYIRVKSYVIRTRRKYGVMHFEVSGFTDETRTLCNITKRKNCKNFGSFHLTLEEASRIHYLPATDPTFEDV